MKLSKAYWAMVFAQTSEVGEADFRDVVAMLTM